MKDTIERLQQSIDNYNQRKGRKTNHITPLTDAEIDWVEKKFELYLPKNFKVFLKTLGGIDVAATEISLSPNFKEEFDEQGKIKTMITLDNGMKIYNQSMLRLTEEALETEGSEFPKGFIMIEFIDDGGYHAIDCRTPDAEDSLVYAWESAENYLDEDPLYSSFKERLEEVIEWLDSGDFD